jgi:hypothetical protein
MGYSCIYFSIPNEFAQIDNGKLSAMQHTWQLELTNTKSLVLVLDLPSSFDTGVV